MHVEFIAIGMFAYVERRNIINLIVFYIAEREVCHDMTIIFIDLIFRTECNKQVRIAIL